MKALILLDYTKPQQTQMCRILNHHKPYKVKQTLCSVSIVGRLAYSVVLKVFHRLNYYGLELLLTSVYVDEINYSRFEAL